jgi:predicted HTH transcriptional regulator
MSERLLKDLLTIRDEITRKSAVLPVKEDLLYSKILDMEKKLDTIQSKMGNDFPDKRTDSYIELSAVSPVKNKRKRKVVEFLNQTKRLTASELSILLNISRTRCCEYLKELQKEGIVKNRLEDKKMYYSLA